MAWIAATVAVDAAHAKIKHGLENKLGCRFERFPSQWEGVRVKVKVRVWVQVRGSRTVV